MASSKDFEKIWKSYQDVAQPRGVSIVDHCQRNGIVYSQFQRWYQKHIDGVSIILVYSHHLYRLYDLSYEHGYSFMKIEREDGKPLDSVKAIDWKYLVALLV